jgi:uncharacterized protein with GYD domain
MFVDKHPIGRDFHCLNSKCARNGPANGALRRSWYRQAYEYRQISISRRIVMATYVVLSQFTDQGIRTIKNSPQRASQVAEVARSFGCEMKEVYWTMGQYDIVSIVEAPDEQSFAAFGFAIGSAGNIRTQTLRAFSKNELGAILGKLS